MCAIFESNTAGFQCHWDCNNAVNSLLSTFLLVKQSLQSAGVAAAQTQSIVQLRDKYARIGDGKVGMDGGSYAFSIDPEHPSGHCVTRVDHYSIRPSNGQIMAVAASEKFGHSTRDILLELGYSQLQTDALFAEKIVASGWSGEYLPS